MRKAPFWPCDLCRFGKSGTVTGKATTAKKFVPLIPGIIHVTGEPDVGKTTFAFESGARADRICFIDDDVKGHATVEQIIRDVGKLGRYVDLRAETRGLSQLQVYAKVTEIIDSIETGQYDVIIFDTWSRYASTMKAYVRKNPSLFREPKDWAAQGNIKGPQQWKEAQGLEAAKLAQLNELAPVVIIVTHLRNQYIDNRKTDKQIPDASKTVVRVPNFRLWLRRNPTGSPVPIGLVLKRIDVKKATDRGLRTISVLPPRIQPRDNDESLWDTIAYYVKNPVDKRKLEPHETPNEFEQSLIEGTLTEDQKHMLFLRLQADVAPDEEEIVIEEELLDIQQYVHDMREENLDDSQIASLLKEEGKSYREIAKALDIDMKEAIALCKVEVQQM